MSFKTKAIAYGQDHEEFARKEYTVHAKSAHTNVTISLTGVIISIQEPWLAATPDAMINCDCCGSGCLEIKCPYRMNDKNISLEVFATMSNSFLVLQDNGHCKLAKNHAYYFQVQLQMYVTKTNYTDFVVWSRQQMCIERIYFDAIFVESNIRTAKIFHSNVIIPQLLVRWYSESKHCTQSEFWCDCQQLDDGREMIRCANEDCRIQWFHLQCLNLKQVGPNDFWFCKTCSKTFLSFFT